jgi:uncharacterized protein (UPF0297 family)
MNTIMGFDLSSPFEYENGFHLTGDNSRIGKLLAHYELYKKIIGLPGHIFEFGVHKGNSLIRFATFRELLESSHSRKIIGFDTFDDFPETQSNEDNEFISAFVNEAGKPISTDELEACLQHKGINNVELVKGNILTTLPDYLAQHPETKAALIHVDVDVYEPTKVILEKLFERLVPGGLLLLDDYAIVAGETRAVDEYFKDKAKIEKLPFSHRPSYIQKTNV